MPGWYIHKHTLDYRTPVEINPDGGHVIEPRGPVYEAKNGKPYRQDVHREGQVVPAQPGWYVVAAGWGSDGDEELELDDGRVFYVLRRPIVAWELGDWGAAYVAGSDVPQAPPVRRVGVEFTANEVDLLICHAEYQPEPDPLLPDIAYDVQAAIADSSVPASTREEARPG